MKDVSAVVLAAGESKRMRSDLSKLLHRLGHRCLVEFPVQACIEAGIDKIIVVVGHQADKIKEVLGSKCKYAYQEKRLGTGDALRRAISLIDNSSDKLVVLPGDAPFVSSSVLHNLVRYHESKKPAATILTAILPDPGYYGRVIRNGYESVKKIVESKNATQEELKIKEVNSGIYCFDTEKITPLIPLLRPNKVTGEIYLTDIFEFLYREGERVEAFLAKDPKVAMGVNTPEELKRAYYLFTHKDDFYQPF